MRIIPEKKSKNHSRSFEKYFSENYFEKMHFFHENSENFGHFDDFSRKCLEKFDFFLKFVKSCEEKMYATTAALAFGGAAAGIWVVLMNFVQFCTFWTNLVPFRQDFVTIWLRFGYYLVTIWYPLTKIKKMKVPRINHSIRESLSEFKSSLSGLFRPSHLPYKAKSEKCSIFVLIFISPYFPYYPLKGLPIKASMACHSIEHP